MNPTWAYLFLATASFAAIAGLAGWAAVSLPAAFVLLLLCAAFAVAWVCDRRLVSGEAHPE